MFPKTSRSSVFIPISTLIFLMMIMKSASVPNYLANSCSNDTMFANNSQYQANLNTLFRYLSSNASNPTSYHRAVSSNSNTGDNAVYGHFLCRGDQNASSCRDCVTMATTTDLPKLYCPNRKDAIIWYDECMVRYSNYSFFNTLETFPAWFYWSVNGITGDTKRFMEVMQNMMNNVIAVRAANGGSQKKFAVDFMNYTSYQTIYGLGQCTPDLTPSDCNTCLVNAVGNFRETQGGRILQPSCVVRYEVYAFFDLSFVLPGTNASHSSGDVTNITVINNCNHTVWPAILTNGNKDSEGDVTSGFRLVSGESKTMNIKTNWAGSIWGRTLCSLDDITGNFSCVTGDCGTGKIECKDASTQPVTMAEFRIAQVQNQDMYDISVSAGYNLPIMVAPYGVRGDRCTVTGCALNLNDATCPSELRDLNTNSSVIGCRNPCASSQDCCQVLCQSSDYSASSRIFEKSCPRAHIMPLDLSTKTFTCESFRTSYNVTFCPPSSMIRSFQSIQESMPPASSTLPSATGKTNALVVAIVVPIAALAFLIALCTYYFRRRAKKYLALNIKKVLEDFTTAESLMFELETLQTATNYFSDDQKLGGGGFGNVYKGTLPNGQEIAVKRLSRISDHGMESFKNEAVLIAKLQHKNLVKLLGFCLAEEEKLLVYEFVPNKSLNYLLFDPRKQGKLDWPMRYNIITGIARGLLYLHEDSRPRIIHRDLKAANILLDAYMNPKISDFGLARIFKVEQTEENTSIIAGTYGYMAPEYAMHGQFSIKSDVYSFGVLLLEIVSGKKINSRFHPSEEGDLLTHAWKSWKTSAPSEFMDSTLRDSYSADEILKCLHLGLLSVQENAQERPTMSTIVFMLNTNSTTSTLPRPRCPRCFYNRSIDSVHVAKSSSDSMPYSRVPLTMSEMDPR